MIPTDAATTPSVPELLDAQIACARELQDILEAETLALLAADIARLGELVHRKQLAAEQLEQLSRSLGIATGGDPARAIPDLGEQASQRWQTLTDAAEVLRKVNLHNGALLDERQARLRWIARQAGLDDDCPTYGDPARSRGGPRSPGLGRSLAQA